MENDEFEAKVLASVKAGHAMERTESETNGQHWTCATCGDVAVVIPGEVYGGAVVRTCEESVKEFGPRRSDEFVDAPERRVRLLARDEHPVQYGVVVGTDVMPWGESIMVQLDEEFFDGPHDDGLREVVESDLETVYTSVRT